MVKALARALGCTEGRVWTLGITLLLTATLVPTTFPAGLRPRGDTVALPAAPSPLASPAPVSAQPTPPPSGVLPPIPLPQPLPQPSPQQPPTHPDPAPVLTPAPPAPARPGSSEALRIVQTGWYDADADATLRQQVTPVGELPVSADRGVRAATSVFRLTGKGSALVLAVDTGAGRTVGTAAIELCRNTTAAWTGYDAMPATSAPAYDPHCIAGKAMTGDLWSFAIDQLGPADPDAGFTLRATVSGGPTETFAATFFRELPS